MEYTITRADICELAHEYAVLECREKSIEVDNTRPSDDVDVEYTEKAQDIFNRHLDFIENHLINN